MENKRKSSFDVPAKKLLNNPKKLGVGGGGGRVSLESITGKCQVAAATRL